MGELGTGENISAGAGEFDIQWMPPGAQDITCFVQGNPKDLQFTVQARHAAIFNEMLQRMRSAAAAGAGDEPFFDFDHQDAAASGHPTELYWAGDDPKKGGIRAKGKWTGSGKAALANRDFTRFSPQWRFHSKTGEPLSIESNLGGLVNRAAFRQIAAVAKGQAGLTGTNREHGDETMTREEFNAWLSEGLKPLTDKIGALEAQAKAPGAAAAGATALAAAGAASEDRVTQIITLALKPVTDRLAKLDEDGKKSMQAQAKAAVLAHVKRGAIAPEDTDTIATFEESYLANADRTEKAMAKLPSRRFQVVTTAGGSTSTATAGTEPEQQYLAKAKEFGKENKLSDAEALVAYGRTTEGAALYTEFRAKFVKVV